MKIFVFIFILVNAFIISSCHSQYIHRTQIPIDSSAGMLIDSSILGYVSPLDNVNLQLDLYQKGIRFYAFSSWETWEFEVYPDSLFKLKTASPDTLSFPYAAPAIAQDANVIHYTSSYDGNNIGITIRKQPVCEDEKGAVNYPFAVIILLKKADGTDVTYNGCGFYLADPIINDIWVMTALRGEIYEHTSFTNGIPTLEFHLEGMKVYGFGGCNDLSGSFYIDRDQQLVFDSISVRQEPCIQSEPLFIRGINHKSYTYSYGDTRLILKHKDGTAIVFKKVD